MSIILKRKRGLAVVASAVTPLAGVVVASANTTTGHVDVYVDHSELDSAISRAESAGIIVTRDATKVLTGDSVATETNINDVKKYYADKVTEFTTKTNEYKAAVSNYDSTVAKNKADADYANAQMDALKASAAAQGRTVVVKAKPFESQVALTADIEAITRKIEESKDYNSLKDEIANYALQQNAMTSFQTQADQGNILLSRRVVTISSPGDTQRYLDEVRTKYQELQRYVAGLANQTGTVTDKPSFVLYDFVIDDGFKAMVTAPLEVYHYTPIPVEKPAVPTVRYNFYDVRSTPKSDRHAENKDGETIVEATKASANGAKVVQAMVNQTVAVETDNQPLPSNRFDKFHSLVVTTYLPDNATLDEALTAVDAEKWTYSYDEGKRAVTFKATDKYLVEINQNQNVNNGTVGGTVNGEFGYESPAVFFKLDKDNTTYQVHSETIVNHEYIVVGERITIRTDGANPVKHNYNSNLVQIDGKAVLPGSINNYEFVWDFDQYKGVNIDRDMQTKGLRIVDDYTDEALELVGPIIIVDNETGEELYRANVEAGQTRGNMTLNGAAVDGFVWEIIDAETAPDELKDKIQGKAIQLVYVGHDNTFYKNWVENGRSVKVKMPMKTLKIDTTPDEDGGPYNGNTYTNVVYQSDFGNPYKSNVVTNTAPLIDPRKDAVLSFSDLTSLDLKANPMAEIEHGTYFNYRLKGSTLPTNMSEVVDSYRVTDTFVTADDYQGEFIAEIGTTFYFKAGTTYARRYPNGMKPNSDITKYFTQSITRNISRDVNTATQLTSGNDDKLVSVELELDKDFIEAIDFTKTQFHVDFFLKTKRASNVDAVENVFTEYINGIDYGSNRVVTNTKENAIDALQKKLAELTKRVDQDDIDDAQFREETISALSIVIRTINENKESTDKAISDVKNDVNTIKTGVDNVKEDVKKLDDRVSTIASAVVKLGNDVEKNRVDIADNKTEIDKLKKDVDGVKTDLVVVKADVDKNKADIKLTNELLAKMQTVVTKLAKLDSSQDTTGMTKIELYTVKTEAEARKKILELKYKETQIVSIRKEANKFVVLLNGKAG